MPRGSSSILFELKECCVCVLYSLHVCVCVGASDMTTASGSFCYF
jgi:hypothetical protein